ncbi:hypothetical protein ACU4GI_10070 [Cupriavidus basilensis]
MNARTEPTALSSPRLDDRFEQLAGKVFLTGNQAILRIALDQRRIDARLGRNTGGLSPATADRRWAGSTWSCGASSRCCRQ